MPRKTIKQLEEKIEYLEENNKILKENEIYYKNLAYLITGEDYRSRERKVLYKDLLAEEKANSEGWRVRYEEVRNTSQAMKDIAEAVINPRILHKREENKNKDIITGSTGCLHGNL